MTECATASLAPIRTVRVEADDDPVAATDEGVDQFTEYYE